jgi:fido (protein-threonine AMPylation protein)
VPDDPYADPVTGVLLNKLGLGTATELASAEREITHAALILLRESPVRATYDLPHLCTTHRRIFSDIYEWAGEVRTAASRMPNVMAGAASSAARPPTPQRPGGMPSSWTTTRSRAHSPYTWPTGW